MLLFITTFQANMSNLILSVHCDAFFVTFKGLEVAEDGSLGSDVGLFI